VVGFGHGFNRYIAAAPGNRKQIFLFRLFDHEHFN
jgi:hypothetical protein